MLKRGLLVLSLVLLMGKGNIVEAAAFVEEAQMANAIEQNAVMCEGVENQTVAEQEMVVGEEELSANYMDNYLDEDGNLRLKYPLLHRMSADYVINGDLILDGGRLELNGYDLSVGGDVIILKKGCLEIGSGRLDVSGDFNIGTKGEIDETTGYRLATSAGYIGMVEETGEVHIGGNFTICSSGTCRLYRGTMYINGDFAQYGTYDESGNDGTYAEGLAFRADTYGTHKVVFSDDKSHNILIEGTRGTFQEVDFGNGDIVFEGNVDNFTLSKDLRCSIKQAGNAMYVCGQIDLNGHTMSIDGDVDLIAGSLSINGGTLKVSGNLYVGKKGEIDETVGSRFATSTASIYMSSAGGTVNVEEDLEICSTSGVTLTGGTLYVGGDLLQYGTYDDYERKDLACTDNFVCKATVVFADGKNHDIYFDSTESYLGTVDFGNGKITILSNMGNMILDSDVVFELQGSGMEMDAGWAEWNLNGHTLTVKGDLNCKRGELNINGGKLKVWGNLSLGTKGELADVEYRLATSNAALVMKNAADEVRVGGDFKVCSCERSYLSAGTMYIGGDFAQYGTNGGSGGEEAATQCFNAEPGKSHKVVFTDGKPHEIFFESTESGFNMVDFGSGELVFLSALRELSLYEDAVWNLKKNQGQMAFDGELDLNDYTLTINGDVCIMGGYINTANGHLEVNGDINLVEDGLLLNSGGSAKVNGNFYIGTEGEINETTGEREMTSDGNIQMGHENAELTVEGDMVICTERKSYLTNGKIFLEGDFFQYGNESMENMSSYDLPFCFRGGVLVLCGQEPQTVWFEYGGYENFFQIALTKPIENYSLYPENCYWYLLDWSAPILTVVEPSEESGAITDEEVTFRAQVNELAKVGVYLAPYVESAEYTAEEVKGLITAWKSVNAKEDFVLRFGDLTPNTKYGYLVVAYDQGGNITVYGEEGTKEGSFRAKSFTTDTAVPVFGTLPTLSGVYGHTLKQMTLNAPATSTNGAQGSWEIAKDVQQKVPTVGTKTAYKVVFTPEGDTAYQFETLTVEVVPTVKKRPITVTVDSKTKKLGEENPELTYSVTQGSLVGDDTLSDLGIKLSTTATKDSEAGDYDITGTSNSANYSVTIVKGTLSIKELTAEDMVENFVERMYTVALNRVSDPSGVAYWTEALLAKELDGASLSTEFILGEEFTGKDYDDEEYIQVLYRTFFSREADESGKSYWLSVMESGSSRATVLAGFVNSNEFFTLCGEYGISRGMLRSDGSAVNPGIYQFAERLYSKILEREGDEEGIEYWTLLIDGRTSTPEDAAMNFFFSPEYLAKNTTDEEYIKALYRTFMGREADEGGLSAWKTAMDNGTSREAVLSSFAQSAEFKNIMAAYGL